MKNTPKNKDMSKRSLHHAAIVLLFLQQVVYHLAAILAEVMVDV